MARPVDIVRALCPKAKLSYVAAFENGDELFARAGITTPLRLAHFLAQVFHETDGLSIERESGSYSAKRLVEIFGVGRHSAGVTEAEAGRLAHDGPAIFDRVYGVGNPAKARELGNTRPGDGWLFRGNGLMQTTGGGNHRRMGEKCGVDFYNHPELVLSAEHALKPALAEWTESNLNVAADRDDILTITKRINGGTNGLADRAEWLRRIKPLVLIVDLKAAPSLVRDAPKPVASPPVGAPPAAAKEGAGGLAAAVATGAAAAQAGLSWYVIAALAIAGAVIGYALMRALRR